MMALIFLGFGVYERRGAFAAYMILFGLVLLCGAGFALVNRSRIARM